MQWVADAAYCHWYQPFLLEEVVVWDPGMPNVRMVESSRDDV